MTYPMGMVSMFWLTEVFILGTGRMEASQLNKVKAVSQPHTLYTLDKSQDALFYRYHYLPKDEKSGAGCV